MSYRPIRTWLLAGLCTLSFTASSAAAATSDASPDDLAIAAHDAHGTSGDIIAFANTSRDADKAPADADPSDASRDAVPLPDTLVETVRIPASGELASTEAELIDGVPYTVIIHGTLSVGHCDGALCPGLRAGNRREGDAAFVSADGWVTSGPASTVAPGGLRIDGEEPELGPLRLDHTYTVSLNGLDQPLTFQLLDGDGTLEDNNGFLEASIYRVGNEPLARGRWTGIPEVLCADAPRWIDPGGFSAATSALMAAAAVGQLPRWPAWVDRRLEASSDLEEGEAPRGWDTDWGQYLGSAFQLAGGEPFTAVSQDRTGAPMSGIAGAVGLDAAAGRLGETLKRLGLKLELWIDPDDTPIALGSLTDGLQEAAAAGWPTVLELSSGGLVRYGVAAGYAVFEDRLELLVWDPEQAAVDSGAPARYRIYREGRVEPPIGDDVPEIDAVVGFWAVSSPRGPGVAKDDLLLDDGGPWFLLSGDGLTWGRSFDLGLGAPVEDTGGQGWGLTWVETTGAKRPIGEGAWRVRVEEAGTYDMWVYISPEIDRARLVGKQRYHLTTTLEEPLSARSLVGEAVSDEAGDQDGWFRVGSVALEAGEDGYVRLPFEGGKGKRVVLDGIRLTRRAARGSDADR